MQEAINRKDRSGIQLHEGDIVAESTIGEVIWGGKGIVTKRPLGIVVIYRDPITRAVLAPEESDVYNVRQIRKGEVELTDKADDWMVDRLANGGKLSELNISRYDGDFYAWNNIERIGSVFDLE